MKTVAALSLAGLLGAQAFVAPAPKLGRSRGVAKMSFENEPGVTAPLGYWVRDWLCAHACCVLCLPGRFVVCLGRVPWPRASQTGCAGSTGPVHLPPDRSSGFDPSTAPTRPPQDPLGFSADGDVEKFNRYRAIEIKHGRGTCVCWVFGAGAGVDRPSTKGPAMDLQVNQSNHPTSSLTHPQPSTSPQWPCLPCSTRS